VELHAKKSPSKRTATTSTGKRGVFSSDPPHPQEEALIFLPFLGKIPKASRVSDRQTSDSIRHI
jgi:hypothetical protein